MFSERHSWLPDILAMADVAASYGFAGYAAFMVTLIFAPPPAFSLRQAAAFLA